MMSLLIQTGLPLSVMIKHLSSAWLLQGFLKYKTAKWHAHVRPGQIRMAGHSTGNEDTTQKKKKLAEGKSGATDVDESALVF